MLKTYQKFKTDMEASPYGCRLYVIDLYNVYFEMNIADASLDA